MDLGKRRSNRIGVAAVIACALLAFVFLANLLSARPASAETASTYQSGLLTSIDYVTAKATIDDREIDLADDVDMSNLQRMISTSSRGVYVNYTTDAKGRIDNVVRGSAKLASSRNTAAAKSAISGKSRGVSKASADLDKCTALALDAKLGEYLTNSQIDEMHDYLTVWSALMVTAVEDRSSFDEKLMKKVLGKLGVSLDTYLWVSKKMTAKTKVEATSTSGTDMTIDVTLTSSSVSLDGNMPFGSLGEIAYTAKGKGISVSGTGAMSFADVETFANSVKGIADAQLKGAYSKVWGNNFNEVAELFVSEPIGKLLNGTNAYSDGVYKIITQPARSACKQCVVKCPVDVYVYDSSGSLDTSIVDGAVTRRGNCAAYVRGDEKYVVLEGDDYEIRLVGTGAGTMDYVVNEFADDDLTRTVTTSTVPLSSGREYYAVVSDMEGIGNDAYRLTGGDGKSVDLSSDTGQEVVNGDVDNGSGDNTSGYVAYKKDPDTSKVVDKGTCNLYLWNNVSWAFHTDGTLFIGGSGLMQYGTPFKVGSGSGGWTSKYEDIPWLKHMGSLKRVIIGEGIQSIGLYAFYGCPQLESVSIPSTVTHVASGFLSCCKSLKTISLSPENESLRFDGSAIFEVDSGLRANGKLVYEGMALVSYLAGSSATSYDIPEPVAGVDENAFDGADNLKRVTIPASVTYVDYSVFCGPERLERIEVDPANKKYASIDGVLYNKKKTTLVCYPGAKKGSSYTPPKTTKGINSLWALCKAKKLKTLVVTSKKITASSVRQCFANVNGSYQTGVTMVKVRVSSDKKTNKKYVKKYKKVFTKANCGKKVTVK